MIFKNNLNINFEEIDLTGNYTSIRDRITIKLNERINTFNKSGNENFEVTAELLEIALEENLDELLKCN
jgi:hypothetical protein